MNDTVGLKDMRPATSRSSYSRILDEQRHRFRRTLYKFFRRHNVIDRSTGISAEQEQAPGTLCMI